MDRSAPRYASLDLMVPNTNNTMAIAAIARIAFTARHPTHPHFQQPPFLRGGTAAGGGGIVLTREVYPERGWVEGAGAKDQRWRSEASATGLSCGKEARQSPN